jgi:hypothetical protein
VSSILPGGLFLVVDGDPSHYFDKDPRVIIEQRNNGHDAGTSPGPVIEAGSAVTRTYVVTDAGNVPL